MTMPLRVETHYIPPYTVESGRLRQTLCGRYRLPHEHSASPTCAECLRQMAALHLNDTDLETAEDVFG